MDKRGKKDKLFILSIFLTLIILIIPLVYANLFKDLKSSFDAVTGRGTSSGLGVAVESLGNNPPNITFISLNQSSPFSIVEGGRLLIQVSFLADDPQGADNLDNLSAKLNISSVDASVTSTNTTCDSALVSEAGNQINYTCTVLVQYYDPAGDWHVSAEINDSQGNSIQNSSLLGDNAGGGSSWFVSALTGMNLTPTSLTFPSVTGDTYNITSNNDPLQVENTGNQDKLDVFVEGITMFDDNVATEAGGTFIPAENFTISPNTGASCSGALCTECQNSAYVGTALVNDTATNITGPSLVRGQGNLTDIYLCLVHVPLNITLSNYSTGKGTSAEDEEDWTISVAT
jgi:hypothetical protein